MPSRATYYPGLDARQQPENDDPIYDGPKFSPPPLKTAAVWALHSGQVEWLASRLDDREDVIELSNGQFLFQVWPDWWLGSRYVH